MLTHYQIQLLRSLKKTAVILLLMAWIGRPTGETEIASILEIGICTARRYLVWLERAGFIRRDRFHAGFQLANEGFRLLSNGVSSDSHDEPAQFERVPAIIINDISLNQESEVESTTIIAPPPAQIERVLSNGSPKPEKEPVPEIDPELAAAFKAAGIVLNTRTRRLAQMSHVTPEYVRAHYDELKSRRKGDITGLLIVTLESGLPAPEPEPDPNMRYVTGEFADFIEH
ncbi:MAG: hypothetical protein EHM70_09300 [Chloroflexota bacterium]|nr:MAG: hypothetical protein EHM70_09300 [Chloroflexota bacterium]